MSGTKKGERRADQEGCAEWSGKEDETTIHHDRTSEVGFGDGPEDGAEAEDGRGDGEAVAFHRPADDSKEKSAVNIEH